MQKLIYADMRKAKRYFLTGAVLAWLIVGGSASASEQPPAGFDCVVTPSQTVDLGSEEPGQLREVLVDRSDRVTAGQVVATLDSRIEEASVAIASRRAVSDTELSLRKAVFAIDRQNEKRVMSLAASNAVSEQERDQASRDSRLSAWRLLQAEEDLELYDLELSRAEAALDLRRVRSPIDGVVIARLLEPGEHLDKQPLLRIVKLDPLYVEAILPMRLFGKVKAGMSASVLPEFHEGPALEATVSLVDPMGDAGSGTFGARLSLPNPNESIAAGVKCRVVLDNEQASVNG